ncbi:hypothetical protein GCM10010329_73020 [Streptomyces spiroverticillatus]|uniref:Uncharacterized protein n=1 Tax=Streptomyces finlayi TaxID=67296 RepID=A0A918X5J8_9ACTN|nr:hypothetical protein [Streptomyces finlayi]GHA39306.1 hypothetical protein GCM10010329_73020 [Streptomyces spiroverticillatus]GHD14189.1 hypothetical protein GCM10010334_73180 [Streptomyces finlayi]
MPFDPYAALNAMIRAEVRRSSDSGPSPLARRTPKTAERSEPARRQAPEAGHDKR